MLEYMSVSIVGQVGGAGYELVTISQAAKIHNYHPASIRKMADCGEIIAIKIGRQWFVSKQLIKTDSLTSGVSPP